MNNSQTSFDDFNHANLQRSDSLSSFSMTSEEEETIFLVDNVITTRHKRTLQPFSLKPINAIETLALAAWEGRNNVEDTRVENSYLFDSDTVNTIDTANIYDNDDDSASVVTCSTTTTATATTTTNYPSIVNVTLTDLMKMRNNDNYNTTTTSVVNKSKQKTVNFKNEIVESPAELLKNPLPSSITSNDPSTIEDYNNSSRHGEISITPSLSSLNISQEFEMAKLDKQKILRGWVKCLWPQQRLPNARQLANRLNPRSLLKRNLNPLTVGIITTYKSVPMISTAIVKGTKHLSNGIEKDGQIKFVGEPVMIKGIYDPREYLLLHCPTYHNPPYYNGDWTEQFLLNKVLPKLAIEATRVQNEAGLYLTVKETLLRGLEQYSLYECKLCTTRTIIRTFTYNGIHEHLSSDKHRVKNITHDEDLIKVNLRAYVSTFYNHLPPNVFE